jgi:hypothetical protein
MDAPLDVETVGKELFGRPCRLALALWIAGRHKPRFYQSEPPREVILQGDLAKELGHLVRLGMLARRAAVQAHSRAEGQRIG